jgi:hypothetical protein
MKDQVHQPTFRVPTPDLLQENAYVTVLGCYFSDPSTWQANAVRILAMLPPARFYAGADENPEPILTTDCHSWLQAFANRLASEGIEPARVIAALEGGVHRGWFYTILLDLPELKLGLDQLSEFARTAGPAHWQLIVQTTRADGPLECAHLLGRFGWPRLTESKPKPKSPPPTKAP